MKKGYSDVALFITLPWTNTAKPEEHYSQENPRIAATRPALTEKADLQATIDKQLETIQELTGKAGDTQKTEQRNRELHNRADNLRAEIAEKQKDNESLQKALKESRKEQAVPEQWVKELEAQGESAGAENVEGQESADQAA
jgi:predicted RNase H-like nuclease (RuvC/YqgF family)